MLTSCSKFCLLVLTLLVDLISGNLTACLTASLNYNIFTRFTTREDCLKIETGKWGIKHSQTELRCSLCSKAKPFDHDVLMKLANMSKPLFIKSYQICDLPPKIQQVSGKI